MNHILESKKTSGGGRSDAFPESGEEEGTRDSSLEGRNRGERKEKKRKERKKKRKRCEFLFWLFVFRFSFFFFFFFSILLTLLPPTNLSLTQQPQSPRIKRRALILQTRQNSHQKTRQTQHKILFHSQKFRFINIEKSMFHIC